MRKVKFPINSFFNIHFFFFGAQKLNQFEKDKNIKQNSQQK